MDRLRQQLSEKEYNTFSVKLELQADYYAGVWAHHADKKNHIIEEGDIQFHCPWLRNHVSWRLA